MGISGRRVHQIMTWGIRGLGFSGFGGSNQTGIGYYVAGPPQDFRRHLGARGVERHASLGNM